MFRNYLLVAWRNLRRQFSYTVINILGLAIGMACSLVMMLYVYSEWSYDRHFTHADRIYKIGVSFLNIGQFGLGPEALGDFLPKEYAGIEAFTRVQRVRDLPMVIGDKNFKEPIAYYTDTSFFKVFSYEFLMGKPTAALRGTGLVMTEKSARRYFGDNDAMGQTVLVGKDKKAFTVTGIVRDDSRSSQLKSTVWLSNEGELTHKPIWTSAALYNYVLLKENQYQPDLESALDRILKNQVYPHAVGVPSQISFEDYKKNENSVKFFVHPLMDVHLKSKLNYEISPGGNESMMYAFLAVGLLILLLAAVNFVNLTTARASGRAREVGIRKVGGSSRGRLVVQFTLESVLVSLAAMIVSLLLAEGFLRAFEWVSGDQLVSALWSSGWSLLMLAALAVAVGLLAGIYPAFYLTSFVPVKVLKGNSSVSGGSAFRNVLVVFQFTISVGLMICLAVVMGQLDFLQNKDLGFDQQHVLTIDNISLLKDKAETFRNELAQESWVSQVSLHTGEPGSKAIMSFSTYQTPEMKDAITINTFFGDPGFVDLLGFHVVQGRALSQDIASDSSGLLLNEAAVKAFGLKEPLGAVINKNQRVIGVVKDFHWESLRNSIAPVVIMLGKDYYQMGFRLAGGEQDFLKKAEATWNQFVPEEPMAYHFLDENFGQVIAKEKILGKAIGFFTMMAIFISCLGLYGISAFTAEQRTREIGIRKVLGATATEIVGMLNRKFALLVLWSILFAAPVSIWLMNRWLEEFAYRIAISSWLVLVTVSLAFLIAFLTVSYHSLKAAWINPADTLKYE